MTEQQDCYQTWCCVRQCMLVQQPTHLGGERRHGVLQHRQRQRQQRRQVRLHNSIGVELVYHLVVTKKRRAQCSVGAVPCSQAPTLDRKISKRKSPTQGWRACRRWPRCFSRSAAACSSPCRRRSGWPASAATSTASSHQARPFPPSAAPHQGASTSLRAIALVETVCVPHGGSWVRAQAAGAR